jgi:uncharacterized protein (TIGR03083 family)
VVGFGRCDYGARVADELDLGSEYRAARERISAFVRTLGTDQLLAPTPACPGWTVHDVVSHLTGVASDVVGGRLGDVPDQARTAAQVAERKGTATSVVLREWERSASQFELLLTRMGSGFLPPLLDVVHHEHDIRGAVDRPGERDSSHVAIGARSAATRFLGRVESAGLAPVVIVESNGRVLAGTTDAPVRFTISEFELFRAAAGRRSVNQMSGRFYGGKAETYTPHLFAFRPRDTDLIE